MNLRPQSWEGLPLTLLAARSDQKPGQCLHTAFPTSRPNPTSSCNCTLRSASESRLLLSIPTGRVHVSGGFYSADSKLSFPDCFQLLPLLIFHLSSCPCWAGVLPSPCFPNFLARTTFVLESLSEVKNPGEDAIFGDFLFNSSNIAYIR